MKSKWFFCLLFLTGVMSAWAQSDSVANSRDSSEHIATPVAPGHATPELKNDEPFSTANSAVLKVEEVPPFLRKALADPMYEGWRDGTVRRHLQTGEFQVELIQGTEKKTFHFNSNGERIPEE